MEDEEKSPTFVELLAKRRRLQELRNTKLKLAGKQMLEINENSNIPKSPTELRSISPPPFSPLTPLMLETKLNDFNKTQENVGLVTPSTVKSILNNYDALSPMPIMSPATAELYNVLINDPKLFDDMPDIDQNKKSIDSGNTVYQSDSDDSIRDPDFIIEKNNGITVEDSDTDCDSVQASTSNDKNCSNTANISQNSKTSRDDNEGLEELATVITENANKRKSRTRKQRQESKAQRNTGKAYVTEKGIIVPKRTQKALIPCRLKCAERFSITEQMLCFDNYWKMGSRDRRAYFIAQSITILPKKTQTTSNRRTNRDCYCKYMLEIANETKSVCKECFCRILGETKGFINIAIEKKKMSPTGIVDEDQRGRNPPTNKTSDAALELVKKHILSFPSYESHYCRQTTNKKYLSPDLSIAKMYRMYKTTATSPVSLKIYNRCFHDLKLSFKKPSKDTCNTCDVFNMKIKVATDDSKINLEKELNEHQQQAEKAYVEKRNDKEQAKTNSSFRAYAFDLQQCLPTPYLKTGISFYKRQLWSFNLTIHDLASDEATCYMWDETIGGRGANQIASCLWHFCKRLPSEVEEITFYSDTCGGQNKNNIVAMMFLHLLSVKTTLKIINHKFLVSGHTHMECDSDHAIIEKTKKRTQMKINHLNDWVQLVRSCKVNKPFDVVVMGLKDFLSFSDLKSKKGPFTTKKTDDSGAKFLWQPVKWLRYDTQCNSKIMFKTDLDNGTPFRMMDLKKRAKILPRFNLNQISTEPLPISSEKKKDLMDLLELVDDIFKEFYINIKTADEAPRDPDLDEDNPDINPDV